MWVKCKCGYSGQSGRTRQIAARALLAVRSSRRLTRPNGISTWRAVQKCESQAPVATLAAGRGSGPKDAPCSTCWRAVRTARLRLGTSPPAESPDTPWLGRRAALRPLRRRTWWRATVGPSQFVRAQFGSARADTAPPPGGGQARLRPFANQGLFKLGQGAKDMNVELPMPGAGIHLRAEAVESHASIMQLLDDGHQMGQRRPQSVQFPHDQHIPGARVVEDIRQPPSFRGASGAHIGEVPSGTPVGSLGRCLDGEVDAIDDRQRMARLQAQQRPIRQG